MVYREIGVVEFNLTRDIVTLGEMPVERRSKGGRGHPSFPKGGGHEIYSINARRSGRALICI